MTHQISPESVDKDVLFCTQQDEEDIPNQTILEEIFTSDYNVTDEEVIEYAGFLGIDEIVESHLLPIVRSALLQPLPRPWTAIEDDEHGRYFYNRKSGKSSWTNPIDPIVRNIIAQERAKSNQTDSCIDDINTWESFRSSKGIKDEFNQSSKGNSKLNSYKKKLGKNENKNTFLLNNTANNTEADIENSLTNTSKQNSICESLSENYDSERNENDCFKKSKDENIFENAEKRDLPEKKKSTECVENQINASEERDLEISDIVSETKESVLYGNYNCDQDQDSEMHGGRGKLGALPSTNSPLGSQSLGRPPLESSPIGNIAPLGSKGTLGSLSQRPSSGPLPSSGKKLTPLAPLGAPNKLPSTPSVRPQSGISSATHKGKSSSQIIRQPSFADERDSEETTEYDDYEDGHDGASFSREDSLEDRRRALQGDEGKQDYPPRSILKDPVMARVGGPPIDRALIGSGLDRISRESKNIRFNLDTDDMQFHSSEEDQEYYDEEELDEEEYELEEEEEISYEDEEDYDSQADEMEEESYLRRQELQRNAGEITTGLMLQDASDLVPSARDPWADELGEKQINKDTRDPLKEFKKQKEKEKEEAEKQEKLHKEKFKQELEEKQRQIEKEKNLAQQTPSKQQHPNEQNQQKNNLSHVQSPKQPSLQSNEQHQKENTQCNERQTNQKTNFQQSKNEKNESQRSVSLSNSASQQSQSSTLTPATKSSAPSISLKPDNAVKQDIVKNSNQIKNEALSEKTQNQSKSLEVGKPMEERKLELESTATQRKNNPLDRVVAKLKTENRENSPVTEVVKNENSQGNKDTKNTEEEALVIQKINQENKLKLEEEEKKLQLKLDVDLKSLKEKISREYTEFESKIRNEHKQNLEKLQNDEKKKNEASCKQILVKMEEENKKFIAEKKEKMEKDKSDILQKISSEIESTRENEIEKIKMEFVREMTKKKDEMQKEHIEEMKDLESELSSLYTAEKSSREAEIEAAQAAAKAAQVAAEEAKANASLKRNQEVASSALLDLEKGLSEVLRERQEEIKRSHNKQLSVLRENLDKVLEKAKDEAIQKERAVKTENQQHLQKIKESHAKDVADLDNSHKIALQELQRNHQEELDKLNAEFKSELTLQKNKMESQLKEIKIEHERQINGLEEEYLNENDEVEDVEEESEEMVDEMKEKGGPSEILNIHSKNNKKGKHTKSNKQNYKWLSEEEKKYDSILMELRERRHNLEEDLKELKNHEEKVKELKKQQITEENSLCDKSCCLHETKYTKLKTRYSKLVERIKSEKAKKHNKPSKHIHDTQSSDSQSLSVELPSLDSSTTIPPPQTGDINSSIISSPSHTPYQLHNNYQTTSEISEDEELRIANEVLKKYKNMPEMSGKSMVIDESIGIKGKLYINDDFSKFPKEAWIEDELMIRGKKVLEKTNKFIQENNLEVDDEFCHLTADTLQKEILRQNAKFSKSFSKNGNKKYRPGGSLTSDTESDELSHEHDIPFDYQPALQTQMDFGLDKILADISSKKGKFSPAASSSPKLERPCHYSRNGSITHSASFANGMPHHIRGQDMSGSRLNSPVQVPAVSHYRYGSAPDLGPQSVDRITAVNQYLQDRWTNYFGDSSLPLGGRSGWSAQLMSQPMLQNKTKAGVTFGNIDSRNRTNSSQNLTIPEVKPAEEINISQKIEDLRAWLDRAQSSNIPTNL